MPEKPLRVLTVCTANVCRSPVAERVFQRELDRAGIPAVVRSAGTHGGELDIAPDVVRAAREKGIDVSNHRSRLLTSDLVRSADLIVTMTREHLRFTVELDPDSWPVTFTLKELYRRSQGLSDRSLTVGSWIEQLSEERSPSDLLGRSAYDDLSDPYGGPYEGYRRMVDEVNHLVTVHPVRGAWHQ